MNDQHFPFDSSTHTIASPHFVFFQSFNPPQRNAVFFSRCHSKNLTRHLQRNALPCILTKSQELRRSETPRPKPGRNRFHIPRRRPPKGAPVFCFGETEDAIRRLLARSSQRCR